ncbi:thioredoxin family protein [Clostridium swellfunianum]|uniref:thioredoxin family protein n=1 Tax=Clostridium swellfunianum TaxID=1367462 RepID=UPI00202FC450|nr:thioredoxin family protein [Clostridium swellfunianum]MCM0647293.1 thioredoxin family protein [Clostridium swellfunianum]
MVIKILGTGCAKCHQLEENARKAAAELGINATVEKVEDIKEIMKYGVMRTPAIVVDEKVKSFGRVLTPDEIKKYL